MPNQLREVATIEQRSESTGNPVPSWEAFAEGVRCEILSVGGGEKIRGHQVEETTRFVVRLRYRSGLTSAMRVAVHTGPFTDRTLNIDSVKVEDHRVAGAPLMVQLHCKE